MAKRVSPPKATAGEGHTFEDFVVAHYLLFLLLQKQPLPAQYGHVVRLDFQTESLGWLLDDLLITLKSSTESRCWAISIKSNTQFTARSAPPDFTRKIWSQFLASQHESCRFQIDRDLLGLATARHGTRVWNSVTGLLEKTRAQHAKDVASRLQQPGYAKDQGALLASFQCPSDLAVSSPPTDEDTTRLVARIFLEEFDFLAPASRDQGIALELCRFAVNSEAPEDAAKLWDHLVSIARSARPKSGFYDLPKLASELANSHRLKAFPRYANDWKAIGEWTRKRLDQVPSKIGRTISLSRFAELTNLGGTVEAVSAVVVLGSSGIGKTVLLKHFLQSLTNDVCAIWLDAAILSTQDLDEIERRMGVVHPFVELIPASHVKRVIIVIDGIDRLIAPQSFARLTALMKAAGIPGSTSVRFVATSQPEEWERVRLELTRADCPLDEWHEFALSRPDNDSLKNVWQAFPSLLPLATKPHLHELISTPRFLDLLASQVSSGKLGNADDWIGESSLIDWYWQIEVKGPSPGVTRAAFIQRLALEQADKGELETALLDLPEGSECLPGLIENRICVEQADYVAFYHDSVGDWARQRVLLANSKNLGPFLSERTRRPHWHRAIRLYAVHLLEHSVDAAEWMALVEQVPALTDFFLDAIIFAARPKHLLELVWTSLASRDGDLLRRFIRRFRHVASQPNRELVKTLVDDRNASPFLRTIRRDPSAYWPVWVAVLEFFQSHIDDLRRLAPVESAELARIWLEMSPPRWRGRSTAALIAVSIAEDVHSNRLDHRFSNDKDDSACYAAALFAATELPDRLTALVRKASSLDPVEIQPACDDDAANDEWSTVRQRRERIQAQLATAPWPDGPLCDVDVAFRNSCIGGNTLGVLVRSSPTLARQVILALLIEVRRSRSSNSAFVGSEGVGVEHVTEFFRPFYRRGPFLGFLQISPHEGIQTIIRLVNYATDRFCEVTSRSSGHPIEQSGVRIATDAPLLRGEYECFLWNRGTGNCSGAVVSALMALERWLCSHVEEKQPINGLVDQICEQATSVAMIGMLSDVGRAHPELFLGALRPILTAAEFHLLDQRYLRSGLRPFGLQLDTRYGEKYFNEQRDWMAAEYRKKSLLEFAIRFYGEDASFRDSISTARERWSEQLKEEISDDLRGALEHLCGTFSPDAWDECATDDTHERLTLRQDRKLGKQQEPDQSEAFDPHMSCYAVVETIIDSLSKSEPVALDEIDKFWIWAQTLGPQIVALGDGVAPWAVYAEAAVATWLLKLNSEQLAQFPDHKKWCEGRIHNLILTPPQRSQLDERFDFIIGELFAHVAHVMPRLWAALPMDGQFRRMIAKLATNHSLRATAVLLESAAEVRSLLGPSFTQLVHFVLRFAAAHWESNRHLYGDQSNPPFEMSAWWEQELPRFVEGSLPAEFPTFASTWCSKPRVWYANSRGHDYDTYQLIAPMALEIVQAAIGWIPPLTNAISIEERNSWVFLWREAVMLSVSSAQILDREGEVIPNSDEDSGMPFEFDKWLFERIASVVIECDSVEEARLLWTPILSLGRRADWWVREFLRPWFRGALQSGEMETFGAIWQEMAALAVSTESWTQFEDWNRMSGCDLWCELLGIDDCSEYFWKPQHKKLVEQARKRTWYGTVAVHVLASPDSAVQLIRWLRLPAAEPICQDALNWIQGIISARPTWIRGEELLADELASFLDYCWRSGISRTGRSDDDFQKLVRFLSELQNPLAMDLEDRIARGM